MLSTTSISCIQFPSRSHLSPIMTSSADTDTAVTMNSTLDPIAIVGMGCRFSGDATSPEKLWKLIEEGRSTWAKIPSSRFKVSGVYHPDGQRLGSTNVKGGHFLEEDPGLFDASFFNMSSEVARDMDPHHRLLLEVVYEALESAGLPISQVAGTNTGVFGGTMYHDYHDSLHRDPRSLPRYGVTGNAGAMLANRISHFFDLRGPSVSMDTACSTALTALHMACQSLRAGESDMAIVVGGNLMLNSDVFVTMSNLGFLSPDGISYAFDSRANGYGRGEGVAAIVLKALPRALADHDPVRALVRATALNQDGRTPTISMPSAAAQEKLIKDCYAKTARPRGEGIDTSQTVYVEAHGTGTPTGDPLELEAISKTFRREDGDGPLFLGSVKANLGHTEAASGLASVIKVVLALEKGMVPPNARFLRPSRKLGLTEKNIKLLSRAQSWPATKEGIRRASVNNFGFGGSNAHAILEWYDSATSAARPVLQVNGHAHATDTDSSLNGTVLSDSSRIYLLSAKDEQACKRMASNLQDYIQTNIIDNAGTKKTSSSISDFLASLAYTLGSRRSLLPWKFGFSANSLDSVVSALGTCSPARPLGNTPGGVRLGWVFTGQGAQWPAMGRELFEQYPVFRDAILESDSAVRGMGAQWTIMEELYRDEETSRVNNAEFSLPLSTAVQIGLVRLLWSWGVRPTAITSHSSGEAAAAFAAGVLSARTAIGITYLRGLLTRKDNTSKTSKGVDPDHGGMMAVGLGRGDAERYISRVVGDNPGARCLVVGCVNSPSSVTLSGDMAAIEEVEKLLFADGVFARKLKVTEAFHSRHMEPMAAEFERLLVKLLASNAVFPSETSNLETPLIYSSPKTGKRMESLEPLLTPSHWRDSMLQPVEFESSFVEMCWDVEPGSKERCVDMVVEIGPSGALRGPIRQILESRDKSKESQLPYTSCLWRSKSAVGTTHSLAIDLIQQGYRVNMDAINFPHGRNSTDAQLKVIPDLPTYPWNHQIRYWGEPRVSQALRQNEHPPHHLMGSPDPLAPPFAPSWTNTLRISDIPWVRDHIVGRDVVFPGAGFIAMALDGMAQAYRSNPDDEQAATVTFSLQDIELKQALVLDVDGKDSLGIDLRLSIRPCDDKALGTKGWHEFSVHSINQEKNNTWIEHCTGMIRIETTAVFTRAMTPLDPETTYCRKTHPRFLWETLHETGICHGPMFQNMTEIQTESSGRRSLCTFRVANTAAMMACSYESQHIVHPTTLDSVIQAAYTPLVSSGPVKTALVPRRVKKLMISSALSSLGVAGVVLGAQVCMTKRSTTSFSADLSVSHKTTKKDAPDNILMEIEGLAFQSLGANLSPSAKSSTLDTHGCWLWSPDITLMPPSQLQDQLHAKADPNEKDLILDLRRCTIHFIKSTLDQLTHTHITQLSGHWKKYHRWMTSQLLLARQNLLGPNSSAWLTDSPSQQATTRNAVLAGSVNGEMICRLGEKLLDMLQQKVEPLEVMMQDRLLSRYYAEALKWKRSNTQASRLVKLLAHKNPRLRVLEIGAGTGGCTEVILDALALHVGAGDIPLERYDFTDVSAGFFEKARERFARWDAQGVISFHTLDIEEDPVSQGFEAGGYDVVVACQVLHATRSMRRTLDHVRGLLKPGGKLVLVETTRDELDLFFTFGMLPGWWLSEEPEREMTPSLSPALWETMLKGSGFGGVDLRARDCVDEEFYMISTIVATATTVEAVRVNGDSTESAVGRYGTGIQSPPADRGTTSDADDGEVLVIYDGSRPPPSDWLTDLQTSIAASSNGGPSALPLPLSEVNDDTITQKRCIFLGEVEQNLLATIDTTTFAKVKSLLLNSNSVIWVSRGATMTTADPMKALHLGLLRTVRNETNKPHMSLDLDPQRGLWTPETIDNICRVLTGDDGRRGNAVPEFEYAERGGVIHVPRVFNNSSWTHDDDRSSQSNHNTSTIPKPFKSTSPNRRLRMQVDTPGLLDSLCFREEDTPELAPGWVEIEPATFGVNFTDIMVAMGQIKQDPEPLMGFECAGIITKLGGPLPEGTQQLQVGDRVCALLQKGHWATRVHTPITNVVPIPGDMSFEDAASIPQAFATAYISLFTTANLRKGEKVLIHSAAGGVGQAAVMLSQLVGAEVFATAGTQAKRDFLSQKFGIPPDHIFSSRDESFVTGIAECTNGKGVQVALNSLAGNLLQATFDCMAEFGRFVEIGQKDLEQNSRLSMRTFMRNVSFQCVDLLVWERGRGDDVQHALREVMRLLGEKDGHGKVGLVEPVSVHLIGEIERVFRTMQGGQHVGKLVVSAVPPASTTSDEAYVVPVKQTASPTLPKLKPDASYLVVGGLGGIGRRICEWLVDNGAKNLVITSRSAASVSSSLFVSSLEQRGCQILHHHSSDISDPLALAKMLEYHKQKNFPPIRGLIQCAMVLKDSLLSQMTLDDFNSTLRPKVQGTWNLHTMTLGLGNPVDFFIMLSSLVGVMGGAGQANYAAASTFQDALAGYRRAQGLPAITIDLGMVKSIGYVAEAEQAVTDRLERIGYKALREDQVLGLLGKGVLLSSSPFSVSSSTQRSVEEGVVVTGINTAAGTHWSESSWLQEGRFSGLKYRSTPLSNQKHALSSDHAQARSGNNTDDIRAQLTRSSTYDEAFTVILKEMTRKLMRMFGLAQDDISSTSSKSLASIGVDSLVAIELRTWILAQVGVDVPIFELMEGSTVVGLTEVVVGKLGFVRG